MASMVSPRTEGVLDADPSERSTLRIDDAPPERPGPGEADLDRLRGIVADVGQGDRMPWRRRDERLAVQRRPGEPKPAVGVRSARVFAAPVVAEIGMPPDLG